MREEIKLSINDRFFSPFISSTPEFISINSAPVKLIASIIFCSLRPPDKIKGWLKGFSKLLDEIRKNHKNIYGIISNAGEGSFNKLENFSESEILNFFNLNLISHIILSKKMISALKKNKTTSKNAMDI